MKDATLTKQYVLGFLIDVGYVLLIRKNRPEWQAGKLNGIGGHVEPNENIYRAMVREFKEETGKDINDWKLFAQMYNKAESWEVHCFWAYGTLSKCKSVTDEKVEIKNINDIKSNPFHLSSEVIENIPWLLSMIESNTRDNTEFYRVEYIRKGQV